MTERTIYRLPAMHSLLGIESATSAGALTRIKLVTYWYMG